LKKIIIYGSREFAHVVKDLVVQCGHHFVGFIDDFREGHEILGKFAVITDRYPARKYEVVMGVGYYNLQARWMLHKDVCSKGYHTPSLIHPNAYVRDEKKIKKGAFIMAGSVVDVNVEIDELVVIWPGVVVNHDSKIGSNTFLSPNSTVCGCVTVGSNCFVGAGAVIVDHNEFPDNSYIKAGGIYYKKKSNKEELLVEA